VVELVWQLTLKQQEIRGGQTVRVGDACQREEEFMITLNHDKLRITEPFLVESTCNIGGKDYIFLRRILTIDNKLTVVQLIDKETASAVDRERFSSFHNAFGTVIESGHKLEQEEFERLFLPKQ
jgi:hypothetical protein